MCILVDIFFIIQHCLLKYFNRIIDEVGKKLTVVLKQSSEPFQLGAGV